MPRGKDFGYIIHNDPDKSVLERRKNGQFFKAAKVSQRIRKAQMLVLKLS